MYTTLRPVQQMYACRTFGLSFHKDVCLPTIHDLSFNLKPNRL